MDQIRKFMAVIGKLHFWLLCLLAASVALVGWKLASAALTAKFDENKRSVTGHFSSLQAVKNDLKHPNERINEAFRARAEQQKQLVAKRWQDLYEAQRKTVLRWPPNFGPFFSEQVYQLQFGAPIPQPDREVYQSQVLEMFQKEFPSIVKASSESLRSRSGGSEGPQRPVSFRGGAGRESDRNPVLDDYVLHWDDYADIVLKLDWKDTPTAIKIWITQEDLWVYKTLLNIIARTNEGAKGPHDAVVKRIVQLQVGPEAALESNAQSRILRPAAGGDGEAQSGAEDAKPPAQADGEHGQLDADARDKLLLDNRYLDENGKPMPGDSVIIGDAATANPNPFNRLPVRMALEMDARRLEELLVECANAELPVEVQQVRINVDPTGAGNRGGAYQSRTGDDGGLVVSTGRRGVEGQVVDPAVVPVIVQGTIYIYNPPNLQALGLATGEPVQP
jgi:hypothetical protein